MKSFNPAEAEEGFKRNRKQHPQGSYTSGFNPAEAEEGFKRISWQLIISVPYQCFNPAEAEEGFKRGFGIVSETFERFRVSIQPKPKKGLKALNLDSLKYMRSSFNPAEAEEGFKRRRRRRVLLRFGSVSIQPKPKKGLKDR